MKPAWMLTGFSLVAALGFIGCNMDGVSGEWVTKKSDGPAQRQEAPAAATNTTTPPASITQDPDSDVAPLAQRIQSYVGQFPPDDLDRKAAGARPAAPAPPPVQARQSDVPIAQPAAPAPTLTLPPVAVAPPAPAGVDRTVPPLPSPGASTVGNGNANKPVQPVAIDRNTQSERVGSPQPQITLPPMPEPRPARIELSDVRPAANAPVAPKVEQAAQNPNQPVQGSAPKDPATTLLDIIAELEAQVLLNPAQLDDQFRLRLMYLAIGDDEKATAAFKGADAVQSDLVIAIVRATGAARRCMQNPSVASPGALTAIDELRRLLSQQSPVIIPRIAMVTRVNSFGDYDAVNPPKFPAGKPVHVFLYTEVSNFKSEPSEDKRLRTVLSEKVEIFDANGKVIWQRAEPQIEDRVLSPRRDFFMTMEIQLPETTAPGDYVLKVTVEDKLAATTDQQRMTFSIGPN